jgi:hypothetical protein
MIIDTYTVVKKVCDFPFLSWDVTYQTLPGRNNLIFSRPGRVWFVTSRLGTRKPETIFYSVMIFQGLFLKNYTAWVDELVGMRAIMTNFADIRSRTSCNKNL